MAKNFHNRKKHNHVCSKIARVQGSVTMMGRLFSLRMRTEDQVDFSSAISLSDIAYFSERRNTYQPHIHYSCWDPHLWIVFQWCHLQSQAADLHNISLG